MIYTVFICDDYHPLFLVVWSLAAYHDDRHGLTMIACDTWRLSVKDPGVRWRHRPVATDICLFYIICTISQASSCSICFQRLGFASPDLLSKSSSHIHGAQSSNDKTSDLQLNLSGQTNGFVFSIVLLALSWLSMFVWVWSLYGLCHFVWILSIWTLHFF